MLLVKKEKIYFVHISEDSVYHGKKRVVDLDTSYKRQLMQGQKKKGWGRCTTKAHTASYFPLLSSNP